MSRMLTPAAFMREKSNLTPTAERILSWRALRQCALVYLDGEFVGFTQGSHLQAEFELTGRAAGKATLRIVVYKWCFGSYLDMTRISSV